jgi:outer membrane receptor protein involved in Fe transport
VNPNFVSTGNPNLNPELSNTFELTYSHYAKGSVIVNINYAFSNNAIQNVTYLTVNQADTIITTTYQNLGTNHNLGINLSVSYPIAKNLSFSANGRITRVWLKGTFNSELYSNSGYTGNINTSMSYKFNNDYRLSFTAFYHNGNVTLQGKDPSQLTSYFTGSKLLFNKKVTLALVAVNPYSKYTTLRGYTRTIDFSQYNTTQTYYRYFIANINYRFGRLNKDIKKNQRNINNDDIK